MLSIEWSDSCSKEIVRAAQSRCTNLAARPLIADHRLRHALVLLRPEQNCSFGTPEQLGGARTCGSIISQLD